MKVGFDGGIKLEFHGAKVSSNGGLLAYRDLEHVFGLFDSVSASFIDKRTVRNIQHAIPTLLRQSIYSRLAVQDVILYALDMMHGKGHGK